MSLPGNYITVITSNSPPLEVDKNTLSLPNSIRLNDSRNERSVEDFLNGISKNNSILEDEESNSGSVTLKEQSRHSSLLSRSHSEIPCDLEDDVDNKQDAENNDNCSQTSKTKVAIFPEDILNPEFVNQTKSQPNNNSTLTTKHSNSIDQEHFGNPEKIATPTISLKKKVEKHQPSHQDKDVQINDERSSEYEEFFHKLSQMTLLIQQKDEEIKCLSEKLQNFISKSKSPKQSSSTSSSSSSSSSDESEKSFKKKNKEKKEKNKRKKSESSKQKDKTKIKNDDDVEDKSDGKSTEKCKKDSIKNESNEKPNVSEEIINNQNVEKEDLKNLQLICGNDISMSKDDTKRDIAKKLDELEFEVRRLQQANVDSILSFQMLQNKEKISKTPPNDSLINKLLVEHEQLKEELQQLKWEHSKLTQPGLLMEEISHLKKDMNYLRKQNDFLKTFTKQSSRSLNHLASSSHDIRGVKDKTDGKFSNRNIFVSNISNSNNSSNNIYQKLQNNHRSTFEAPNMQTMLKNNIESLESPYHSTYQSIQQTGPFSAGPTYRTRKLSDSSSVLMEDVKQKTWIETVPKNYKTTYNQFSTSYRGPSDHYINKDFDEESVDSYVSVTTSVTERTDDDWRQKTTNHDGNNDLLSTQESELSDDNTVKEILNYPAKSKLNYSFTPKSPSDLNLEDFVKFVRPGGKMSTGRVCFIGHLPGRNEVCVGLELGEDAGKHDGMFEGNRYFQCRKNRGVFISFHKIILAYKPF